MSGILNNQKLMLLNILDLDEVVFDDETKNECTLLYDNDMKYLPTLL